MAWSTPRTWSDGELVTAAIMNTHIRDNQSVLTRSLGKTADESVTSSAALQNDDHLLFAMGANEWYFVSGILWHTSASATPNIKIAFTVPASGAYMIVSQGIDTGGTTTAFVNHRSVADVGSYFTGSTGNMTTFDGIVQTAGTTGNFQLQWCQNTSNGTATTLKKGSSIYFQKVV